MELTTDDALQQGIAAHKAGNLQDAEKLYKAILTTHPKHPDANHNLGILAVGVGKLDESVPYFKTALEASPNVEQFWLSYIDTLIKLGHLDGARQVIQQGRGVGLKGAKVDGLEARLGGSLPSSSDPSKEQLDGFVSLYQQGKYEEALVQGRALSDQFPGNAFIPNILGAVHAALGDSEAAVSSYNKAIEIKPDYAEPYNNLGVSLKNLGRHTEAITSYNKAIELQPDYAEAYNNLGNVLNESGDPNAGATSCRKAIIFKPDYAQPYNNLGMGLERVGQFDEAILGHNKAVTLRPFFAEAYTNTGNIFASLNMYDEALMKYKRASILCPEDIMGYNNLGNVLSCTERHDEAIRQHEKAVKLEPRNTDLHNNIANVFMEIGEFRKAIYHYDILGTSHGEARSLECLFHMRAFDEFNERLSNLSNSRNINIRVAALSAFAAHQLEQRRLARVGEADEAHVGHRAQQQLHLDGATGRRGVRSGRAQVLFILH